MNCKNCQKALTESDNYCNNCGAKIINERLTFKALMADVAERLFKWDNNFFLTVRKLVTHPHLVFQDYIDGIRKRYVNPFTFFAIGIAVSIAVINQFHDEYLAMNNSFNEAQITMIDDQLVQPTFEKEDENAISDTIEVDTTTEKINHFKEDQLRQGEEFQEMMLKNYNLISFLLLPLYTLLSLLVFGKRYNYAEHLVVNAYLQGFTFILVSILLIISVLIHPAIYSLMIPITMFYYAYSYGKLYELTVWQSIVKFFKFILILVGIMLVCFLAGFLGSWLFG